MKNMTQYVVYSVIVTAVLVSCTMGLLVLYSNNSDGQLSSSGDMHIHMIPYNIISDSSSPLDLKKFNSTDELRNFLLLAQQRNTVQYPAMQATGAVTMGPMMGMAVPAPMSGAISSAPTYSQNNMAAPVITDGSTDYSATNIQVSKVDEPDFLQNDSK